MPAGTLIIEDSPIYRQALEELVKHSKDLELVKSVSNFEKGVKALESIIPDLIIMDIEIGEVTCFELLPFVSPLTKIIFVTSKPVYAVQAYDIGVVDFLVKPITVPRFNKAIQRFKQLVESLVDFNEEAELDVKLSLDQRVMIASDDKYLLIEVAQIRYLEALGNYVQLFLKDNKRLVAYGSIKSWMDRLPEKHFTQIHRSTIINLNHLDRIEKYPNETGRAYIIGKPEPLEISRSYFSTMKRNFKA